MEIFNNNDIEYMKEQFENELKNNWTFETKKSKLKNRLKKDFYSYTIPLFSKDKSKAIIYKEFYCGSLCAYGTIEILEKKDNKWNFYDSMFLWMS